MRSTLWKHFERGDDPDAAPHFSTFLEPASLSNDGTSGEVDGPTASPAASVVPGLQEASRSRTAAIVRKFQSGNSSVAAAESSLSSTADPRLTKIFRTDVEVGFPSKLCVGISRSYSYEV